MILNDIAINVNVLAPTSGNFKNSEQATKDEAAPPKPLNIATSCGI